MIQRDEILGRYRDLREISRHHHSGALAYLARPAIMGNAKRLGLAFGRSLIADSEEEMTLVFDLSIYTAKDGRSRAIDRYAKTEAFPPGSDEARVLDAMRQARFSLWKIECRHDIAGVVLTDLVRETETWLVDEALEMSAAAGMVFAGRVFRPENFDMTCGVVVPVNADIIEDVLEECPAMRQPDPERIAADPRFMASIYRTAIEYGVMDGVVYA